MSYTLNEIYYRKNQREIIKNFNNKEKNYDKK
jgi:hypothetical protein